MENTATEVFFAFRVVKNTRAGAGVCARAQISRTRAAPTISYQNTAMQHKLTVTLRQWPGRLELHHGDEALTWQWGSIQPQLPCCAFCC